MYEEFENEKKKGQKNLTLPDRDLNPGFFEQIPVKNLNFEEDEINGAWGS